MKQTSLKLLAATFLAMLLIPLSAVAQNVTVKGTVTDPSGYGVMGAGVMVQGTTNGTVTDLDGNWELKVPGPDTVLEISCLYRAAV